MKKASDEPTNGAVRGNFYVAAGLREGKHHGTFWSDGDCYKWMEALAHVKGTTKDPDILRVLDELIAVIAQAQEEDGYNGTQIQLAELERWTHITNHELYNMGHLVPVLTMKPVPTSPVPYHGCMIGFGSLSDNATWIHLFSSSTLDT